MPYSNAAKAIMLDALGDGTEPTAHVTHMSLHDDTPDGSGSNEIAGGDPAYARKAVAFGAASGSNKPLAASVEFDIPPATDVAYAGAWHFDGDATWTWLGYMPVPPESFTGQGKYTLTTGTVLRISDPE